ncbi:hypothetical protein IQ259_04290 [Fortiea sp. LEGE XX443]|uniref:hypothetical protein n=1 Tax=Fortiea sp. LEGE XX443 TaxID=1828611 RepID=UPI001880D912|nr:hypothetical protein [Fortiea sp. LEGE XX443]MBE9004266.1 hypothetical protein [Fortiea sp. LEGE XX443]
MKTNNEITIKVTPEIAQAYQNATNKEKQSLQTLIALFFNQDVTREMDFLGKIMDEISDRAVARGLTPEILESILNE